MAVGTNDVVRVTAEMVNGTNDIQNVWHLRNDGASVSEADALDDIRDIFDALYALLAAVVSIATVIQRYRAINISSVSDVGIAIPVDDTPFTLAGEQMPLQVAMGMSFDTTRLNSKGRKFFGPTSEGNSPGSGTISAATLAALGNVGDLVIIPQVEANSTWRFGVIAAADGAFLPLMSYGVSTTLVTQRRRRIGVGS